jgi:hypothetical protein
MEGVFGPALLAPVITSRIERMECHINKPERYLMTMILLSLISWKVIHRSSEFGMVFAIIGNLGLYSR